MKKYGVKVFNYLKGYYGLLIFNKKENAKKCHKMLDTLWNEEVETTEEDMEVSYNYATKDALSYEDELKGSQIEEKIVMDFRYAVNNDGYVSTAESDIEIINDSAVTVPC